MTTRAKSRRPKSPTPQNVMQDELVALNAAVDDLSVRIADLRERADRDAAFRADILRAISQDGFIDWKGRKLLLVDEATGKLSNSNGVTI